MLFRSRLLMHRALASILLLMMFSCMLRNGKSFGLTRGQSLQGFLRSSQSMLRMEMSSATEVKKDKNKKREENKYVNTCLLPTTTLDFRANALKREPEIQKFWNDNKVYERLCETNPGEKYILHDGPPYANGDLHIGHALNKILKDFVNKYQTLRGRKVSYVPGWDCHGLPIELKVLQNMKASERQKLSPIQLRKTAAEFAKSTMASQREGFKRYGVWGNWDDPYLTLQPAYEAAQVRVFGEMVEKGHIYRGRRPVNWSPSSRTALAEAELEYPENHVSRSVYVGFPTTQLSPALSAIAGGDVSQVRVAIWTTTPWTLPDNAAVAVNPEIEYCLVSHASLPHKYLLAKELVPTFASKLNANSNSSGSGSNSNSSAPITLEISATIKGSDLIGTKYRHPLYDRESDIVLGGDYINTSSGTGLVHTAPGHGAEDYITGLKHKLPMLSPVDDAGCFTEEAGPAFAGLDVLKNGTAAVITALQECGALIREEPYAHKYPYDWRTKKPTITRMTEQWFASVSGFRAQSMEAIDSVQWIPPVGRTRIASMVEGRADWCISRQRVWGVPIPVMYHRETKAPLMTKDTIAHIESVFRERGSDAWWELTTAELLPPGPLRDAADQYERGSDTMDVWFDSGTSWAGVVQARQDLASFPADMYLEGSDQSRGWFQSSLLTSVATNGVAPFKTVLTHGFVMDEKGMKMSKSIGNVVDPLTVINGGSNQAEQPAYGADTLRLWVAGCDYFHDVQIGPTIMKHVAESFRKLRNTLRFVIGGLSDFNPVTDLVPYEQLPSLDKHALGRLTQVIKSVESGYESYNFLKVSSVLNNYAITDLSAFYLVQSKDRLYVSMKDDPRRKSCQTVLYYILEQMTTALAPILPHLAEDIWLNIPYAKSKASVFEKGWVSQDFPEVDEKQWEYLLKVREDVQGCLEKARASKVVGASMEGRVVLHSADAEMHKVLKRLAGDKTLQGTPTATNGVDDLRFLFCTSQVEVVDSAAEVLAVCPDFNLEAASSSAGVTVGAAKAHGSKCQRCWMYCPSVGSDSVHSDLCSRCSHVMVVDKYTL